MTRASTPTCHTTHFFDLQSRSKLSEKSEDTATHRLTRNVTSEIWRSQAILAATSTSLHACETCASECLTYTCCRGTRTPPSPQSLKSIFSVHKQDLSNPASTIWGRVQIRARSQSGESEATASCRVALCSRRSGSAWCPSPSRLRVARDEPEVWRRLNRRRRRLHSARAAPPAAVVLACPSRPVHPTSSRRPRSGCCAGTSCLARSRNAL